MKSFLATGAILALSLWCSRVEAEFPQSMLGPQAPDWGAPAPTYGAQPYAVPNSYAAQSYRTNVPAYGQPTPDYRPAVPYVASVPQNGTYPVNGGMANGPAFDGPIQVADAASGAPAGNPGPICSYESSPYAQAMGAASWCAPTPAASNCPTWFGGVYGLVMTRDREETYCMFTTDADPSLLYMPSTEFQNDYVGGNEARIGRTFNCCKWGLEFVYWGLQPNRQSAVLRAADVAGTMQSTVDYSLVWGNFGVDPQITEVTDNIYYAHVCRREEYHNAELNLLSGPLTLAPTCGACGVACGGACGAGAGGYSSGYVGSGNGGCGGPRWVANWVFGFRFFKFDEDFNIFMDRDDNVWNSTDYEVFHDIDVENNLYGFQLGTDINYCLTKCLHLDFGSKFGIYGNHATQTQQIYTPQGPAYVLPGTPEDFYVRSSEDEVAFLGELRAGVGFKVGCHFRFTGGYRAVAVSGVATALGQLDQGRTLGSLAKVADINSNETLVLHGAYAGTEFAW